MKDKHGKNAYKVKYFGLGDFLRENLVSELFLISVHTIYDNVLSGDHFSSFSRLSHNAYSYSIRVIPPSPFIVRLPKTRSHKDSGE